MAHIGHRYDAGAAPKGAAPGDHHALSRPDMPQGSHRIRSYSGRGAKAWLASQRLADAMIPLSNTIVIRTVARILTCSLALSG